MKTDKILISIDNLTVRYGANVALRNITLRVPQGSVTALVGPSGCGKSSLLLALNRLSDLTPTCAVGGKITFDGLDVLSQSTDVITLRRRMAMIFQKPVPFPMSIWRNLSFPLAEHGVRSKSEAARRIEAALRDVGLWDEVHERLDRPANDLSGGQQQRLCLARALVLEPDALLLDEPCSALDPIATEHVEALIRRLAGRLTIVIVTHNLGQARRLSDSVVLLWLRDGEGQLVEHSPTERFFSAPCSALSAAYVKGQVG